MGIKRGGNVQTEPILFCPVQPGGEIFNRKCVTVRARQHPVHLMPLQTDPFRSGNQAQGGIQILPQFIGIAGTSGIVARDLAPAGERRFKLFKTDHGIALPGMNGNRNFLQVFHGFDRIHSIFPVNLAGNSESIFFPVHFPSFPCWIHCLI